MFKVVPITKDGTKQRPFYLTLNVGEDCGDYLSSKEVINVLSGDATNLASNGSFRRRVLTVGRKKGDFLFPSEQKCISREHCRFYLEYNNRVDEFALLVENMGKYGTRLKLGTHLPSINNNNNDHDDEAEYLDKALESMAGKDGATEGVHECSLSHITRISEKYLHKCTFQVGIDCSQLKFIRIPYHLVLSSSELSQTQRSMIHDQSFLVGAKLERTSFWKPDICTHLVAKQLMAKAKQLSAWACNKPIVTFSWFQAHLERSDNRQPPPRESQFMAPDNSSGFPSISRAVEDRQILRGYTLISLRESEAHYLALSSGADVVPAYAMGDETFFSYFQTDFPGRNHHVAYIQQAPSTSLSSDKTSINKRANYLKGLKVHCTDVKRIATSIHSGEELLDVEGNSLIIINDLHSSRQHTQYGEAIISDDNGEPDDDNSDERNCTKQSNNTTKKRNHPTVVSSKRTTTQNKNEISNVGDDEELRLNCVRGNKRSDGDNYDGDDGAGRDNNSEEQISKKRGRDQNYLDDNSVEQSINDMEKKRSKPSRKIDNDSTETIAFRKKKRGTVKSTEDSNDSADKNSIDKTTAASRGASRSNKKVAVEEPEPPLTIHGEYTGSPLKFDFVDEEDDEKKLPSRGGWLITAGRDRSKFRKLVGAHAEKSMAMVDENKVDIIEPQGVIQSMSQGTPTEHTATGASDRVDFKTFKKNRIITTNRNFRIKMATVLPKESEFLREMRLSQEDTNRSRLVADELFQDDTQHGRSSSRRQGGGLLSHGFSQSRSSARSRR